MQVFEGFHLFPQQQEFNAPELNIKECNFRLSTTHKAWLSQGQMLAQTTKAHSIMGVMSPTCHWSLFWFWKEKRRALDEGVTLHPTNQAEYSAITSIRASISISEYFKRRRQGNLHSHFLNKFKVMSQDGKVTYFSSHESKESSTHKGGTANERRRIFTFVYGFIYLNMYIIPKWIKKNCPEIFFYWILLWSWEPSDSLWRPLRWVKLFHLPKAAKPLSLCLCYTTFPW